MKEIIGSEKLIKIFNHWPTFHDAEILKIILDRTAKNKNDFGPTMDVVIHVFEMTKEIDKKGFFVLKNHTLATVRFNDVANLQLDCFNHQNAILGLEISKAENQKSVLNNFKVYFDPATGVSIEFLCSSIEVLEVEPFINLKNGA